MLPTKAYKKDSTNKKTTDETLNINIVDSLISSFVAFVWRTFGILLRFFSIAIGFTFFKNKPILLNGFAERIVIVVFVILLFVAYAFGVFLNMPVKISNMKPTEVVYMPIMPLFCQ